jgi:hypothetical protein
MPGIVRTAANQRPAALFDEAQPHQRIRHLRAAALEDLMIALARDSFDQG